MASNKKAVNFTGTHFDIGKELGKWWVEKINAIEDKKFLNKRNTRFKLRLKDAWKDQHFPLLHYAYKNFPEIMDEIAGMAEGINEKGWKTSVENVFMYATGEVWGCSSVLVRTDGGFLLGHNEEDDMVYPLCFANVHLKGENYDQKFVSVSYPFQLFGSVVGMNSSMAFQGNSIGTAGKLRMLKSSWHKRAAKTFFTRKMLECHDIEEVEQLYHHHHAALPSHHFVAFKDEAYSLEIRPIEIDQNPYGQMTSSLIKVDQIVHANHFILNNGKTYQDWKWKDEDHTDKNSNDRYSALKEIQWQESDNAESILKQLDTFRQTLKVSGVTSASLCFMITDEKISLHARAYFSEKVPSEALPAKIFISSPER